MVSTAKPGSAATVTKNAETLPVQLPDSRRRRVLLGGILAPLLILSIWTALKLNPQVFVHQAHQLPVVCDLTSPASPEQSTPDYSCPARPTTPIWFGVRVDELHDDAVSLGLAIRRTRFLMETNDLRVEIKGTVTISRAGKSGERTVTFDNTLMNKFATFKPQSKDSHIFRYLTVPRLESGDTLSVQVDKVRVYRTVLGDLGRDFFQDGDVGLTFVAESDPYKLVYWRIMVAKGIIAGILLLVILQHLWQIVVSFRSRAGYRWKDLLVVPLLLLALLDFVPDCFLVWGKAQTPSTESIQNHFSSLQTMLVHHLTSSVITWCFNFYSLIHFVGRYPCFQYLISFLGVGSALGLYSRLGVLSDTYYITEPLHGLKQLGYRSEIIWRISLIMHLASVALGIILPFASVIVAQLRPQDPVTPGTGKRILGNCTNTIVFGTTFLALQYYIIGKKYYIGDWNLWRVIIEHSLLCIAVIVFTWVPCLEPFGYSALLPQQVSAASLSTSNESSEAPDEEKQSLSRS